MRRNHTALGLTAIFLGVAWWWLSWANGRTIARVESWNLVFRVREVPMDRFPLNMLVSEATYCYTCEVIRGHVVVTSKSVIWESYRPNRVIIDPQSEWKVLFKFDEARLVTAEFSIRHGAKWQSD